MGAELLIGSRDAEHLTISILRRERPNAADFWDANWVVCQIKLRVGGFRASVEGSLRLDEIQRFQEQLQLVDTHLFGAATLSSLEELIELQIECSRTGQLSVTGLLSDRPNGNRLSFELPPKDQSYLSGWVADLQAVVEAFPVVGTP